MDRLLNSKKDFLLNDAGISSTEIPDAEYSFSAVGAFQSSQFAVADENIFTLDTIREQILMLKQDLLVTEKGGFRSGTSFPYNNGSDMIYAQKDDFNINFHI